MRLQLSIFLIVFILTGCGGLNQMVNHLNNSTGELMGTYTAPVLGGSPRPSGCSDQRCRALDAVEAKGYELARQKKIPWVKLVNAFYQKRAELYPNSQDSYGINELKAYQRVLAEQMDVGKITEYQWAYLIESKVGEINSSNEAAFNTAPRTTNCTTTNGGTATFPQYKTTCN